MSERWSFEGSRDLRWVLVQGTLITYLREDVSFDDALWDRWLAKLEDPAVERVIVSCWGAIQPTHQQWRRANKLMRKLELAIPCVTENRHSLALVKAASWIGTNIVGFPWTELHEVCEFAGVPVEHRIEIKTKIPALRDALGRVVSDVTLGRPAPARSSLFRSELGYSSEDIQRNLDELQAQLRALRAPKQAEPEPEPEPARPKLLGSLRRG